MILTRYKVSDGSKKASSWMDTLNYKKYFEDIELENRSRYNGTVSSLVQELLLALGEDPEREGLRRTPERVARMYGELLSGYSVDLDELVNEAIFESSYEDMVVVQDIDFYSLCEHHLLPFFGKAHVAYIPNGRIIGLSKIPRLVEMFARRLQVQERMTRQIAETLDDILEPKGVAVIVEGSHMCAMMRGVKKANASMITRTMLGVFKTDKELREEFQANLQQGEKKAPYQPLASQSDCS